jgi:predicted RNA-binding protein YlxR (DUF448 family)
MLKVSGKPAKLHKHIPQRTCVGCRTVLPKRSLLRLVHQFDGLQVDLTGKIAGRGAYLHNRRSCWEKALKGPLAHSLKITLTNQEIEPLRQFMLSLPDDDEDIDGQG